MPAKTYMSRDQIKVYIASQASIGYSGKTNSYFSSCDQAVCDQSIRLINNYLNDRIETEPEAFKDIEDLIYTLKYRAGRQTSLQMQRALHRLERKKALLMQTIQKLEKMKNLKAVTDTLNSKKSARNLSAAELNVINETLKKNPADTNIKRLRQKAESYALLCFSSLKNNGQFDKQNPEHLKLVNNYNLQHVRTAPKTCSTPLLEKTTIQLPEKNSEKETLAQKFKSLKGELQDKMETFKHRLYKHSSKIKNFVLLGATVAASVFLGKNITEELNYTYTPPAKPTKETKITPVQPTPENQKKTADFAKAAETVMTGDYYDTALQIHLKSADKVQKLYNQIAGLAKDGKISPDSENGIKQYAHAFAMYRLIRPNSEESKAIQNLLNGGSTDKNYIANLVKKAGRHGQGVKPDNNSITHSNFDNADIMLQTQHLKNLKTR